MPSNLPTGYDMVTLEIRHSASTRPSQISYVVQEPGGTSTMANIATLARNAYVATNSLKSVMDSNATLTFIHVRQGTASEDTSSDSFPQSDAGSVSFFGVPPNCALLVKKRTALSGRHGRGRFFIPYVLATTDVDEAGFISGARLTVLQTAMNNWYNAHVTSGLNMLLFHPDTPLGGAAPPGAVTPGGPPTPILDLNCSNLLGTQRRRLGR